MAKIRTRARAVDMLGRQQIAGIQNALSELFKNAHDAYAGHVCVDYFENVGSNNEGFIVIRDDGIGMTKVDFEDKWLVLGTESKVGADRDQQYRPPQMLPRPITGEKGIGRLAIALLGRQVLVLTRAQRDDGMHDLVMALVHWGLFELPGLNLDEIEIPIATFSGGTLPSADDVRLVREQLRECANRISSEHPELNLGNVIKEIEGFEPDPITLDQFFASRDSDPLSLMATGTGTHFLIGPSNPVIKIEIDSELKNGDYGFRRQILGFCDSNTFSEEAADVIKTSFRRWLPGDLTGEDLLDADTFFTREELLEKSDHLLIGAVDEYGQFKGSLKVYDQKYENVIIPWSDNHGNLTKNGAFKISFGILMGRASESKLSTEEFSSLNKKLLNLGGIYVYRDRIRILPYGDHSNDWLEVEKRRNLGAAYYFFSFRRMFGAVVLSRKDNDALQEKAGREGFQQNEAYRQLREILKNLLLHLAAEYFRKGGTNTDLFEKTQSEVRRRSEALERQQKRSTTKRKNFATELAAFDLPPI